MQYFNEFLYSWLTHKKAIFIIVIVGFLVYFNSLLNGFVWDDQSQILENTAIHSIKNFPNFFSRSTFSSQAEHEAYYKPILSTIYSLLYTLAGQNAFVFHFFQLTLHILNTILVWLLFNRFFPKLISLFLSLVFLVHPINTEAVTYISATQEVLFFIFGMMALFIVRERKAGVSSKIIVFILLLLSLLSKESGFLFLLIMGVYMLLFAKRGFIQYLFPGFLALATYLFLRFGVARFYVTTFGDAPIQEASLTERLVTIPKLLLYYIQTLFVPHSLAISQDWVVKSVNTPVFYVPVILVSIFFVAVFVLGIMVWRSNHKALRTFMFFLLWFIVGLGLHAQIFPLDMTVAERWFYFPMVGILGVTGVVLQEFKFSRFKIIMLGVAFFILFLLSARTMVRNLNWKDNLTLFSHDARISIDSSDLENNLGAELFKTKRYDEAQIRYENSIRLDPKDWVNWQNLAVLFEQKGQIAKAKQSYQKAIEYGNSPYSYAKLANLIYLNGTAQETKSFVRESLTKLPDNAQLWLILALVDYEIGNSKDALTAAQKAYQLSPTKDSLYVLTQIKENKPIY